MKKIIFILIFIANMNFLYAQIVVNSQYKALSFEEMYRVAKAKHDAHIQLQSEMEKVQEYLMGVLARNDIDEQMRGYLNEEFNKLSSLISELDSNGISTSLYSRFNTIKQNIKQKIVAYNNKIATEQQKKQNETEQQPSEWTGSGFALKDKYVVTNYHVIEEAKSIGVQGINGDFGTKYNASILAIDKVNDLAILKIEDVNIAIGSIPYSVKTSVSDVGEDVFVLGYPLTSTMGEEIKLTTGVVSSKTGFQGDASLYQISAPIQPGNSGGPLFDGNGDIIGIVSAKHKGAENVGYAIKASFLRNLMESALSEDILPQSNKIANYKLSDKVKSVKNYVYYITCSSSGNRSSLNNNYTVDTVVSATDKTYNNPYISSNISNSLKVLSVKVQDSQTVITFSTNEYYHRFSINKNAFIRANGQRYTLTRAKGMAIAPDETYYPYVGDTKTFTLYFPAIPENTTSIDFIEAEGSDWRLYDIQLK